MIWRGSGWWYGGGTLHKFTGLGQMGALMITNSICGILDSSISSSRLLPVTTTWLLQHSHDSDQRRHARYRLYRGLTKTRTRLNSRKTHAKQARMPMGSGGWFGGGVDDDMLWHHHTCIYVCLCVVTVVLNMMQCDVCLCVCVLAVSRPAGTLQEIIEYRRISIGGLR